MKIDFVVTGVKTRPERKGRPAVERVFFTAKEEARSQLSLVTPPGKYKQGDTYEITIAETAK